MRFLRDSADYAVTKKQHDAYAGIARFVSDS